MFYLDLFRALGSENVRYLLVGGLALNIHGVERATMDIDLVLAMDPDNLQAFLCAAKTLKLAPILPVKLTDLADPITRESWVAEKHMIAFALRPPESMAPTVDILVQSPLDFAAAWARRIEKDLGDARLSVAHIDDLIAMKSATGRLTDASDIAALERLKALGQT